ncbi:MULTISPECIES: non-canonical purine NTP pyrophosphatase [Lactobacillus]|uniref:Non-canonical purine NTP pyrophosphatase n=1 Tax=Lactobacillus xujianguonis TaxID=2495899 RepID=A0A437SXE2_9LACO|nr:MULTISPECIES: non-canonical purine NTP pyrophosphatase [Lactobacillus]RVU71595.1 non-canonical purine NTP pyrophosphatase [Lactobacillus xujianguonis]RVU77753.1 non-canonical purine NTP pyrophosphatase [Lactobacillus xujianguonis]
MKQLLYTTYDNNKIEDLQAAIDDLGLEIKVLGLGEVNYAPMKAYSEATFLNNARKTAHRLSEFTGLPTLSESSGLSVDYLLNSQGILPYHHNGQDDRARLLAALGGVDSEHRTASYYTTFIFTWPGQESNDIVSAGRISGMIAKYPFGSSNYGYDQLFVVSELGKTLGEMNTDERNIVSHRSEVLSKLLSDMPDWWRSQEKIEMITR